MLERHGKELLLAIGQSPHASKVIRKTFDLGENTLSLAHFGYVILPKEMHVPAGYVNRIRMSLSDCSSTMFLDFETEAKAQKVVHRILTAIRVIYAPELKLKSRRLVVHNNIEVIIKKRPMGDKMTDLTLTFVKPRYLQAARAYRFQDVLVRFHTDNATVWHGTTGPAANCETNLIGFKTRIKRLGDALKDFYDDLQKEKLRKI